MNSPSAALVWELWRKNRWGFTLLFVLVAVCGVLSWQSQRLRLRVERLGAQNPNLVVIPAQEVTGGVAGGSFTLTAKLGPRSVFQGPVTAAESLVVEARFDPAPELRLTLRSGVKGNGTARGVEGPEDRVVYHGPFRARALTWSVNGGQTHNINLSFDPDYAQRLASEQLGAETWREGGFAWAVVMFCASVLIVFGIFGVAEPHSRLGFSGLPPRRYTLPTPTAVLVFWPITLGAGTIGVLVWAWSRIASAGLLSEGAMLDMAYYELLLLTGLVWFQGLVWGLPSFPKTRAWLITGLVLILIVTGMIAPVSNAAATWQSARPWLLTSLAAAWPAGAALAWLAASLERRGAWSGWARSSLWSRPMGTWLLRPLDFRSPAQAQTWIETRRNGRLALGIWGGLVCLAVGCDIAARIAWGTEGTFNGIAGPAALVWMAVLGLNVARDPASGKLALGSFTAVRPLSSGSLVQAKVVAVLGLWIKAVIILGIGELVVISVEEPLGAGQAHSVIPIELWILLLVVSFHVLIGVLPVCLTGRMPGFPWSVLPLLLVYGALLNVAIWLGEHPRYQDFLFPALVGAVVLKVGAAYWGFRRSVHLHITSPMFVAGYGAFWIVGSGILMHMASKAVDESNWHSTTIALLPAAALAIPLARIALSPLAMVWNRHR